jgi:hypothetical protein
MDGWLTYWRGYVDRLMDSFIQKRLDGRTHSRTEHSTQRKEKPIFAGEKPVGTERMGFETSEAIVGTPSHHLTFKRPDVYVSISLISSVQEHL